MTVNVIPPVEKRRINSSFDVSHTDDDVIEITATHEWFVEQDPTVWGDMTYSDFDWETFGVADHHIEIIREVSYSVSDIHKERDGHLGVYISQHCNVPDVNGVHDDRKYSYEFPDPWLFEDDQEELVIVNGYPHSRDYGWDRELDETTVEFEPLYTDPMAREDVQTFVYAHHFGLLEDSPSVVEQIEDVLQWRNEDAITLEQYKTDFEGDTQLSIAD